MRKADIGDMAREFLLDLEGNKFAKEQYIHKNWQAAEWRSVDEGFYFDYGIYRPGEDEGLFLAEIVHLYDLGGWAIRHFGEMGYKDKTYPNAAEAKAAVELAIRQKWGSDANAP